MEVDCAAVVAAAGPGRMSAEAGFEDEVAAGVLESWLLGDWRLEDPEIIIIIIIIVIHMFKKA